MPSNEDIADGIAIRKQMEKEGYHYDSDGNWVTPNGVVPRFSMEDHLARKIVTSLFDINSPLTDMQAEHFDAAKEALNREEVIKHIVAILSCKD